MLVRVRLPGGRASARQLGALARCAERRGDGVLYLTSRANIQLRGLDSESEHVVADALAGEGLLPAPEHERVRNYLASPASGYFGGHVDVRPMLRALDTAVCSRPELAALPGRFLFALDDGRGDLTASDADVCWQALDSRAGRLLIGGVDSGLRVACADAVDALVRCAEEFLARRESCWRVRELPHAVAALTTAVSAHVDMCTWLNPQPGADVDMCTGVGVSEQDDGRTAVCVAPVFGELTAEQAGLIARKSDEVVVTPWRTVLVPDIEPSETERVLSELSDAGLGTEPDAGWLAVSSCIGKPACAKAHADVRSRAREVLPLLPAGTRVHFSGCERRCGKPSEPHTDVLATEDGYLLDGASWPADSLVASIRAAENKTST